MQYTLVSADDHLALNYTRKRNINRTYARAILSDGFLSCSMR
jgi:hypothetical protein